MLVHSVIFSRKSASLAGGFLLLAGVLTLLAAALHVRSPLFNKSISLSKELLEDETTGMDGGYAAVYRLDGKIGKQFRNAGISGMVLENGEELPLPITSRRKVDQSGFGRYCIKNGVISFSSTDGSDPRENRHSYQALLPYPVSGAWWIAISASILLGTSLLAIGNPTGFMEIAVRKPTGFLNQEWLQHLLFVTSCVLAVAGKFYLVAGQEMFSSAHDSWAYLSRMFDFFNDCPYPPGASVFFALCLNLGIPTRLGFEVLWIFSCAVMTLGVLRVTSSRMLSLGAFIVIVYTPWTITGFNFLMSEKFVACLLLCASGSAAILLAEGKIGWNSKYLYLMGICVALWNITRKESLLVYGACALFLIIYWFLHANRGKRIAGRLRFLLPAALPLILSFAALPAVRFVNLTTSGVYMTGHLDMPGYERLLSSLFSIRPDEPVRYAPVSRKALKQAIEASPTLAQYHDRLLNLESFSVQFGEKIAGEGEFGSWIFWLVLQEMQGADARATNKLYTRISDELEKAFDEGSLARRPAHYPLDPNYAGWLPDLPEAVWYGMVRNFRIDDWMPTSDFLADSYPLNLKVQPLWLHDFGTLRRHVLRGRYPIDIRFEVAHDGSGVSGVSDSWIEAEGGVIARGTRSSGGKGSGNDTYFVSAEVPHTRFENVMLCLQLEDKEILSLNVEDLYPGMERTVRPGGEEMSEIRINVLELTPYRQLKDFKDRREALLSRLPSIWRMVFAATCVAAFLLGMRRNCSFKLLLGLLSLLCAGIVLPRLLYYAAIIANYGWAIDRYYEPTKTIAFLSVILALHVSGYMLARVFNQVEEGTSRE